MHFWQRPAQFKRKDVSHRDKQNLDAMLQITSKSGMSFMSQIPDAHGTSAFLRIIQCVVDSYLDKKLDPLSRLEKAWYAVFFVRYCMALVVTS